MPYFLFDPHDKLHLFQQEEEWNHAVNTYDFLGNYCDDGWSEEVENLIAGYVPDEIKMPDFFEDDIDESDWLEPYITHSAQQCDVKRRPDDLDEDNYSPSEADYWPWDFDYVCNYKFQPVKVKG